MMYADPKKIRETAREELKDMADARNNASERAVAAMNDNMRAFAEMSSTLTSGVQELSREWWSAAQNRLRTNLELFNKLVGCRTLEEAMSIHGEMAKVNLHQRFEDGRRLVDLSLRLVSRATSQAENNVERATDQGRRAA